MYTLYKEKYPDQVYGYLGRMKIAQKEDSTGAKAVEPINEYIGFLMNDTTKNGPTIAYYHALNGTYYANEAKNFDSSIHEFELAARYDPANAQYQQILNQLTAAKKQSEQQKNAPPKAPATKPKTGAGAKK